MLSLRLIASLCICMLCCLSEITSQQENNLSLQDLVRDLSIKDDPRNEKYRKVIQYIYQRDTFYNCGVYASLREIAGTRNAYLQLRLKLLESMVAAHIAHHPECHPGRTPKEILAEVLEMAYELEDKVLTFQVYLELVAIYTSTPEEGRALLYGIMAKELYDELGRDQVYPMALLLFNLSLNHYKAKEYRACVDVIHLLEDRGESGYLSASDTISRRLMMYTYNTLGLAYSKLSMPDSAMAAFAKASLIEKEVQDPFWAALIQGNASDIYFMRHQWDSAAALLRLDYEGSLATGVLENAASALQWLAKIDLIKNRPHDALQKSRESYQYLRQNYHPEHMASTLLTYSQAFTYLGVADSAVHYFEKYITLHDSIQESIMKSRIENVYLQLNLLKQQHAIQSLNKEKRKANLIRGFAIVVVILIALLGFFILNRQKLKLEIRRRQAMEALQLAEHEASSAREQLQSYTQSLLEKSGIIERLQKQLEERDWTEEQKLHISELYTYTILTDEDWERFKELFQKVYPGFLYALRQKVPDITPAEQRMAAICTLQISNKEAAALLGIAINSVNKAKQRLRMRLGLEPEANLELYFAQSEEFRSTRSTVGKEL